MTDSFQTPPPIEDLSEISWKRVEQGLMNALDSAPAPQVASTSLRRTRVVGALALACMTVAAGGFLVVSRPDRNSDEVAVSIQSTSEISTQDSPTSIVLRGASLEVHSHSDVAIEQLGDNLAIQIDEGGITMHVEPRDHEAPVTVSAGNVQIEVVGTTFSVYREMSQTHVVVAEGIVAVSHGDKRELVRAGEQWPAQTKTTEASAIASSPVQKVDPAEDQELRQAPGKPVDARALFEQAAAKEHSAPTEALQLYRRAAKTRGPWGANALFAQARLLLAQSKTNKAKTLLQRYLRRFPSGPNVADAQSLLKEIE